MRRRMNVREKKGSEMYAVKLGRSVIGTFSLTKDDIHPILMISERIGADVTRITDYSKIFRRALRVAGLVADWDTTMTELLAITALKNIREELTKRFKEHDVLDACVLLSNLLFLVELVYEMDGDERRKKIHRLVGSFLDLCLIYDPTSEKLLSNEDRKRIAKLVDEALEVLEPKEQTKEVSKD